MGLIAPTGGHDGDPRRPRAVARRHGARRLPAREPVRLPVPHAARVRDAVRAALGAARRRARERVVARSSSGSAWATRSTGAARTLSKGMLQRVGARRGARARSRAAHPRRADERPRSGRAQGGARPHRRGEAPRAHGLLLEPHPERRRDALRPRSGQAWVETRAESKLSHNCCEKLLDFAGQNL